MSELRISFSPGLGVHGHKHWLPFLHHRRNSFWDVLSTEINPVALPYAGKWRLTAVCNIPAFQAAVYSRLSATLSSGQIAANRDHFTSTHVLSLACKSSLFVPITATGLFSAMFLASPRAAFKTSCLPPSTTFDTNPRSFASAAEKGRVEYASSWTRDWFPVTFGRRARVPMSAASPISAS